MIDRDSRVADRLRPADAAATRPTPLPDYLALLRSYPDLAGACNVSSPATASGGDLEIREQMRHNRLFALPTVEPTVSPEARA